MHCRHCHCSSYDMGKVHLNFFSVFIHSVLKQHLFESRLIIAGFDKILKRTEDNNVWA